MDTGQLDTLRHWVVDYAMKAGADGAEAISQTSQSVDITVLQGKIENAVRSESVGLGLRVLVGQSQAFVSTADLRHDSLQRIATQAIAMARLIPPDPYLRLARPDQLATKIDVPDLCDDAGEPSSQRLTALALDAENAALSVRGTTRSEGAQAGWGMTSVGLSGSNGFEGSYTQTGSHFSATVIAGEGEGMERDYAGCSKVYFADLEAPRDIGIRAGERAVARLNSRTGKTGSFPVIYDRRVATSLLRSLIRSASGGRIAKGTSFFNDKLGTQILPKGINIIDDPLRQRGLRSQPFDGEGLPVSRKTIVEDGILQTYLLDLRSAAKMGMEPTGHATRGLSSPPSAAPSNAWLEAGSATRDELIQSVGQGFLVTELMGASISLTTGDYSRGASGFWIENGAIAYPVSEMTVAGNLKDMYMHLTPASDLEFREGIDSPSVLIEGMTLASR